MQRAVQTCKSTTCVELIWYSGSGITSRLIEWFTGSPHSHVAIRIGDTIYEALTGGTVCSRGSAADARWLQGAASIEFQSYEPDDVARARAWLESRLSEPYGFVAVMGASLSKFTNMVFGRRLGIVLEGTDICSHLVAYAMALVGADIPFPDCETPASLAQRFLPPQGEAPHG